MPARQRSLAAICLGTALSLLGDTAIYTVLPTHTAEAGILLASVGILLSINRWVRLPLNSPGGYLIERLPRKPVFIAALLLGALSTGMYALPGGLGTLAAARVLWGIAWIGIWVGGNTIVLDIAGENDRGRTLGIYQIAFFAGGGGGALLGGILTDWIGYQPAMIVSALLQFTGALIPMAFLSETRGAQPSPLPHNRAAPAAEPRPRLELASAIALLGINRIAMEGFILATVSLFLQQRFGNAVPVGNGVIGGATLAGIALGGTTIISAVSAPLSGVQSDRNGSRWRTALLWLLPGIAGFALLPLGSPLAIAAGLVGVSASSGSNANLATALIGDLGRRGEHGRRLGVLFTIGDLGSAAGPLLAFRLLPAIGLEGVYLLAAGLFGGMGLVAGVWARLE
jgi:MFS family permease